MTATKRLVNALAKKLVCVCLTYLTPKRCKLHIVAEKLLFFFDRFSVGMIVVVPVDDDVRSRQAEQSHHEPSCGRAFSIALRVAGWGSRVGVGGGVRSKQGVAFRGSANVLILSTYSSHQPTG